MACAPMGQVCDSSWQPGADQGHRHAWLRLHDSLARTLDDLYLVCEGDHASELVESTLRFLEQSVDDFKLLATHCPEEDEDAAAAGGSSSSSSAGGAGQHAVPLGTGAAPHRSSCSIGAPPVLAPGQPSGTSRLARASAGHCDAECPGASSSNDGGPALTQGSSAAAGGALGAQELLHHKLSSPNRLRKTPSQTKAAAEERQARAERLRERLAEERSARLQEQLSKQQRRAAGRDHEEAGVPSAAAGRAVDKHQRSEVLRAAHLRRIQAKAGDETRKVHEVSFINTLTNAGKKADLQQRLEEGEARRAEALAAILAKQQGASQNVREAAERRRQAEADRLAQLADKQRRKQDAQVKLEEERRAAAAAREAARAAARALAQQREAARHEQASQLRERVTVRLKDAAQRRLQHLEMIRERAALGKDFDRRDSFAGGSSGRQSPAAHMASSSSSSSQAGAGSELQQERSSRSSRSGVTSGVEAAQAAGKAQQAKGDSSTAKSKLSALAPCFCPADAAASITVRSSNSAATGQAVRPQQQQPAVPGSSSSGSSWRPDARSSSSGGSSSRRSGRSGSLAAESSAASCGAASAAPSSPSATAAVPLPCEVLQQLRSNSQSIKAAGLAAVASSQRATAKGARRRMAKARSRMVQPGCCYQEPEQAQELVLTPEAQQLLAAWAPHLAVLQLQPPAHMRAGAAAPAAAAAGPPSTPALTAAERLSLSAPSSMSSSATNSPRSSSYAAGAMSTSTLSSTPTGSPPAEHSCGWALSRSSSCCDCDSQHSAGAGVPSRSKVSAAAAASAEQQREALAALVMSASSHVGKQQVLVGHLARRCGLLHKLCQQVLAACSSTSGGGSSSSSDAGARAKRLHEARLLELLGRLLEVPANLDYLLTCAELLPDLVAATRSCLDHCNSLEADAPAMMTGGAAAARLTTLLQVLVAVLEHAPSSSALVDTQEQLVGFMTAAGLIGRLASVFSLFDQPMQQAAQPVPPYVLQCLRLLGGLTAVRCPPDELLAGKQWPRVTPNAAAIVLEMHATSMAGVLSLLTAVLLNASPTVTPAEASSRALPPNFVEAAHLVMAVLNNVCRLDLAAGQHMLACAHHRLEFYHLISFLLGYCLSRWPAPAPAAAGNAQQQRQQHATVPASGAAGPEQQARPPPSPAAVVHHPVAQLLNQVLLLLGFFCVMHPSNQAMLTWGRSPSILQRLCSLPGEYTRVPELRAVLMPTMLCVCFGAERTAELVARHFSMGQLLQYVQQQQDEGLPGQPPGQQQQAAVPDRRERRRQRRAAQQQAAAPAQPEQQQQAAALAQPEQQQQAAALAQPEQQQQAPQQAVPKHAQELLQQVSAVCSGAAGVQQPSSAADSRCPGSPCGSSGDSSSSWGVHSLHSHQAVFGLHRRFPLQLLPAAAEQLARAVGATHAQGSTAQAAAAEVCVPPGQQAAGSSKPIQLALQQRHAEAAAAPAGQQQASEQPGANAAGQLQLQLQLTTAPANLVVCEVVACS